MKNNRIIYTLLFIVGVFVFLRTAWLNDDAFITLRTVDNWVHGYGLTFNPPERVQAYTHPLWMLLMAGMYVIVRDGYFTLILLGLSISIITIVLFFKINDDVLAVSFGWAALMLSKSFVDFSTSGLENPATQLLLLLFITLFLKTEFPARPARIFTLALLAGLSTLNRMDSLLLFLPALLYLLHRQRLARTLGLVAAGFGPFLLWELFSLFYYGFLFPNTYYAKLHAGVSQSLLFNQGILYYFNSISWDPITLLVTFTALAFAFQQKEWKEKQIAFGITFYLFYILYIGGDFMSGRFFSAVFFASVILLVRFFAQVPVQQKYILAGFILFAGILSPRGIVVTFLGTNDKAVLDEYNGISDEREVYFSGTSLMSMNRAFDMPQHMFAQWGRQDLQEGKRVTVEGAAGMVGYYGGPNLHVIDIFALADPLLARLPIDNPFTRIGHFERDLPKGYVETIESGKNQIANPHLAEFYDKMKLITTGNLFLPGRLKTIWEMNTDQYDYLIQKATE
jgi:arabinofuranosyltransferase